MMEEEKAPFFQPNTTSGPSDILRLTLSKEPNRFLETHIGQNGIALIAASNFFANFNIRSTDSLKQDGIILRFARRKEDVFEIEKMSAGMSVEYKWKKASQYRPMNLKEKVVLKSTEELLLRINGREEFTLKKAAPKLLDLDKLSPSKIHELLDQMITEPFSNNLTQPQPQRAFSFLSPVTSCPKIRISTTNSSKKKNNHCEIEKVTHKESMAMEVEIRSPAQQPINNGRKKRLRKYAEQELALHECAICITEIDIDLAKLDCKHYFCFKCISDWSAMTNLCPLCKKEFNTISRIDLRTEKVLESVKVRSRRLGADNEEESEWIIDETCDDKCYGCNLGGDEMFMLVCDECNWHCCHTYCLDPPLMEVPNDPWFCKFCQPPTFQQPAPQRSTSNNYQDDRRAVIPSELHFWRPEPVVESYSQPIEMVQMEEYSYRRRSML